MTELKNMNDETVYWWPEQKKLVFLRTNATPEFWDSHWLSHDVQKAITQLSGSIYWRRIFEKYFPRKGSKILEGGCGNGQLVYALSHWGYEAVGIDFAEETIAQVKKIMPQLDVRLGDVRNLPIETASFDGYYSGGVIEHFWEGYDDIVSEMHRVLKEGGYAIVTFPCISLLDKLKILFSGYDRFNSKEKPIDFYQFAFSLEAVKAAFKSKGFQFLKVRRRGGLGGLKRVWPLYKKVHTKLLRLGEKHKIVKKFIRLADFALAPVCGRGVMVVFRKKPPHHKLG